MTGNFKITLAHLRELGACRTGQREFQKAFPDGGEYQEVLDRCAKEGQIDFGLWLLAHVGTTEDVRVYEDAVNSPGEYIMFAGSVEFKAGANVRFLAAGGDIEAGGDIKAGWDIEAGRDIEAGGDIKAGGDIEAGGGIEAGRGIEAGWGIEAGRDIEAGGDIKAGGGIEAGRDIEAGGEIKSVLGYGIYAGVSVPVKDWYRFAVVSAKAKPEYLLSGHWKPLEGTDAQTT